MGKAEKAYELAVRYEPENHVTWTYLDKSRKKIAKMVRRKQRLAQEEALTEKEVTSCITDNEKQDEFIRFDQIGLKSENEDYDESEVVSLGESSINGGVAMSIISSDPAGFTGNIGKGFSSTQIQSINTSNKTARQIRVVEETNVDQNVDEDVDEDVDEGIDEDTDEDVVKDINNDFGENVGKGVSLDKSVDIDD